jgi:hypothetical protein
MSNACGCLCMLLLIVSLVLIIGALCVSAFAAPHLLLVFVVLYLAVRELGK